MPVTSTFPSTLADLIRTVCASICAEAIESERKRLTAEACAEATVTEARGGSSAGES